MVYLLRGTEEERGSGFVHQLKQMGDVFVPGSGSHFLHLLLLVFCMWARRVTSTDPYCTWHCSKKIYNTELHGPTQERN